MTVAIRKGKIIKDHIQGIFRELNFTPQGRVFVKPNLCGRMPVLPGENTSVEAMDALIEVLQNYNCDILIRYNVRSNVERVNGRLKDEFGGKMVRVRGSAKVITHLMFGIIALTADQLMRFVT